jgi:hypothetical protein
MVLSAPLVPSLTKLAQLDGLSTFSGPPAEFIQDNTLPNNCELPVNLKKVGKSEISDFFPVMIWQAIFRGNLL